ncbi:hypothetical protein Ocin01_19135, partial [Orchesella cincta]
LELIISVSSVCHLYGCHDSVPAFPTPAFEYRPVYLNSGARARIPRLVEMRPWIKRDSPVPRFYPDNFYAVMNPPPIQQVPFNDVQPQHFEEAPPVFKTPSYTFPQSDTSPHQKYSISPQELKELAQTSGALKDRYGSTLPKYLYPPPTYEATQPISDKQEAHPTEKHYGITTVVYKLESGQPKQIIYSAAHKVRAVKK